MTALRTISAFVRDNIIIVATLPVDLAVVTFAPRLIAVPYAAAAGAFLVLKALEARHHAD